MAMDAQQLAQVESLCDALYNAANEAQRASAQQQLMSLQSSVDYIPQCQYILDNSQNPYARLLASNSLTQLITQHWNSFSVPQRVDIRNYILSYLASQGPSLKDYVVTALVQLLCRITKLGWFDDAAHRDLVDETLKFLGAPSTAHYIIGLRILNQLVEEINIPSNGRTLPQHRKTAVSFRDTCLLRIFNIALTALQQLKSRTQGPLDPKQEAAMGESALNLSQRCLSFDFIGTNPDESSEDVGTIQVPGAWREVITDPATMTLFFDFYKTTDPPRSSLAMQSVILLSSVRRSLFPKDADRAAFLQLLMDFLRDILSTQQGLQHQENYHEFCRQLGRLKANYQLSELVRVDGYLEWVELAASFTVKSFQEWQWSANSVHYLLALWGRLVSAVPYVRPEVGAKNHTQRLQECVRLVVQCYVRSMVDSVEQVIASEGSIDDPLDDEGSLKEQLDRLPVIGRFEYASLATFILAIFDPLLVQYNEAIQHAGAGHAQSPALLQRLATLEGQLTWLVYICGALVGGYSWSDATSQDGEEAIDASLCRRMFQLAQGVDFRLSGTGGQGKCSPRLELALLYFFQTFRRMYMWEQHGLGAVTLTTIMMSGALPARPDFTAPSNKQKVFQCFFDHMGLGDHAVVTNIIVTKVGNNLKYWPQNEEVISSTLQLFLDMASSYSSSKLLLSLDTVAFLIQHHNEEHFPFLAVPSNTRHRTTFHMTLSRLIFAATEDTDALFEAFMAPLLAVLAQLAAAPSFRQETVKRAIIGICRDLRGVSAATNNKRTYGMLFEALYPAHFPVFVRAAEEWADSVEVSTALLKFLQEFTHNRAQRLVFDQSSPNGILLFREASKVVCAFGNRLAASATFRGATSGSAPGGDPYKTAYKGAALCMSALTTALAGGYVNFGVFALYGDKALDNALETVLKLAFNIPLRDITAFPKLARAYYAFFEILFRNHINIVLQLDTPMFTQVLAAQHEGLQSLDAPLSAQCAMTIDHLATFYFTKAPKGTPAVRALQAHLQSNPSLLTQLLGTLFNLLLFDNASSQTANQWAVTRPILSLLLADEAAFTRYKEHLLSSQSPDNAARLNECFDKLLADVQRSLDNTNRDRFTQRLTTFRVAARQFLTL
eukprot:TRINITY_DN1003_c0_g1_i5.p1 TRINITY_DN1003_c0_g1~~TRINITY_DN1003_c0_g1_i5.p1  ORF type:complete len:1118 (+),score=547.47 TRINITY_DN1003_c0_g1_i5:341-3694(+)